MQKLLDWQRAGERAQAGADSLAEVRARLVSELRNAFAEPAMCDALFFASPEVHENLFSSGPCEIPEKLRRSLVRYLVRASSRETPFGLFAGHSVGHLSRENSFELPALAEYRSHTRVSFGFLARLLGSLAAGRGVRDRVPHEPNSTVTLVQGDYRLVVDEQSTWQGQTRFASSIANVRRTAALDRALELASGGRTLSAIVREMCDPDVDSSALLDFCHKLCAERILVPAWLPTASGTDSVGKAVAQLESLPELVDVRTDLIEARAELTAADEGGIGGQSGSYDAVRRRLLRWEPTVTAKQPLQTELVKPAPRLTISEGLAGHFLEAADLLQRVARPGEDPALHRFRERFLARYEHRLVPLMEALDGDLGLGFGATEAHTCDDLLSGLPVMAEQHPFEIFDALDRCRIRLLERALARNSRSVELDRELLDLFPERDAGDLAIESLAIMARLARSENGQLSVVAPEIIAPSALALFGRFCEADSELHAAVSRHAKTEQELAGDTILADVVFSPSDDTANVVVRPVLREYEIPCGGRSGTTEDRKLTLSDLLVCVRRGRVQLYSKRLRRPIAVRFVNAHNYGQESLPTVYRFLGALQHQDIDGLASGWSWGTLEGSPFLPRVVCGNIVLSLARWTIRKTEWAPILAAKPHDLFARICELREARSLPRWLTRSQGDRQLPIDLENPLSVEELLHEVRKQGDLDLEELFPSHDQLVLHGPEGFFAGQFVVPFLRRTPSPARPTPSELLHPGAYHSRRCFAPGSDWLYVRIYAGKSRHATIMRELRASVIEPSLGSAARQWFYLPYADPEPHLRVRFQGPASKLRNIVLSRFERKLGPLLESGVVFRFELGTYQPELERYGGSAGVALAERLFCADSEAALDLLEIARDDDDLRWQIALVGIDRLLGDCGAGLERRLELARVAGENYGEEVGATVATWKAIGQKYRRYSPAIAGLLWDAAGTDEVARRIRQVLAARSARIRPIWSEFEQTPALRTCKGLLEEQLPLTFAHLHAVRMLGVSGRAYELVIYDFLRRQYAAKRSTKQAYRDDVPLRSA